MQFASTDRKASVAPRLSLRMRGAISELFLRNLTAAGGEDAVREGVERYRRAGATSPCVGPVPGTDFEATLRAAAP